MDDFKINPDIFNQLSDMNKNLTTSLENINLLQYNYIDSVSKEVKKEMVERYQRDIENNENLKALVEKNEEISRYNKELVSLNEKILNKINSLDDILLFFNKAFVDKSQMDEVLMKENNALLLELITIIESNDETKLNRFISNLAAPVGVGLIIEYLKLKLGLS